MINFGFQGKNSGSSSSFIQKNITSTGARQIVTHNLGKRPKLVTFFYNDAQYMFEYYRTDGQPDSDPLNNIVLYTDQVYTNLEINFL